MPTTIIVCTPAPVADLAEQLGELFPGATVEPFGPCRSQADLEACELEYCTISGTVSVAAIEELIGDAIAWDDADDAARDAAIAPALADVAATQGEI